MSRTKINIKPLSVNEAWKGQRYKTKKHKEYVKEMLWLLPKLDQAPTGLLQLDVTFGLSSKLADIDNPLKPFIDCLQRKYGFNDRDIKRLVVEVDNVGKGEEYIDFELSELQ